MTAPHIQRTNDGPRRQRISETSAKSLRHVREGAALAGAGHDLIHLELGKPHADTPDHIKEATIAALLAGQVHYSDLRGPRSCERRWPRSCARRTGSTSAPDDILVTNGLTHASFAAFMALLDPGDEVILLDPYYPQHVGKIELAGAKAVLAPLDADDSFTIRAELIEAKITPRTRMIVLVNPVNPTGRVYRRDELQAWPTSRSGMTSSWSRTRSTRRSSMMVRRHVASRLFRV